MRVLAVSTAIGALALAATVAAPAVAADYPVLRGSQIEEAPSRSFDSGPNWSGLYIGGSAGLAMGQFDPYQQSEFLSRMAFNQLTVSDAGSPLLRFGKARHDRTGFGGFVGYNAQFGDVVLGVEADYFKTDLTTTQNGSISRLYTNLFPTITQSSPGLEPLNTQTAISVAGHTTTELKDFGILKARAGYAMGNFMPYFSIGAALGRVTANSETRQGHTTVENTAIFNTITGTDGTVQRSTFNRNGSFSRPDASGGGSANIVSTGYVPGFAIGAGIEALLGDTILLRAEYNRVYFSEYKGVNIVLDTARVGAGIKF